MRTDQTISQGLQTVGGGNRGLMNTVEIAFAAVPGVIALIGAAVGHGRTMQRINAVEADVHELKGLNVTVARIDERTKAAADDMKAVREDISTLVMGAMDMVRSFAPNQPTRRRSS